ncbi:hypothetical protein [Bartonella sp. AC134YNZD]|uniref:hypothetical protein n=1 Tax=Bartonella sp. AC134YNZD TaxID=3243446 RepID=UPI0035CEB728
MPRNCPKRGTPLPPPPPPQRKITICYTYGQEGHISPNYPNRGWALRQKGSSAPQGTRQQSRQATSTSQSRTGKGDTPSIGQSR